MPRRAPTQEDMLEALRLKAVADGAVGDAQKAADEAEKRRTEAQRKLDEAIKAIEADRTRELASAQTAHDKTLAAIDKTLQVAYGKSTEAQEAVEAHRETLREETGAEVNLAGSGSRGGSTHL